MFVYKLGCFFKNIVLFFLPVFCFSFNIFLDFSVSMPGKPPSLIIEYNYCRRLLKKKFSLIPEADVHMNFAVNLAIFFRTTISYYIDNHIQNRCSKKSRKTHGKTPLLEILFNKAAGLRPAILLKKTFQHRCFPVNFEKFL